MQKHLAPILLLVFLPRVAWADPPVPAPLTPVPAGPDVITSVMRGQPAPHDGQLFDPPTALRWGNYLQQCHSRLKLDVVYQYKLDQADVVLAQTQLNLERQQYAAVTEDLRKRLNSAQQEAVTPPFYRTMWFGVLVGVATTVVVVAGTAALVSSTR